MNSILDSEERRVLSLEQGRELLKNTRLSEISDEELQELLETVRIFCEINFDQHLNNAAKCKVLYLDKDLSNECNKSDEKQQQKKAA